MSVEERLGQVGEPDAKMAKVIAKLANAEAVLTRQDLVVLGYERRAVEAIFRACDVEYWPGYKKPMIRVAAFREWRQRCTYGNDRVRPC